MKNFKGYMEAVIFEYLYHFLTLSFFSYFFILLLWQLEDKTLMKILQLVTFEIRAILQVTTWSKNCC